MMKKVFTAMFALLLLATTVQAQRSNRARMDFTRNVQTEQAAASATNMRQASPAMTPKKAIALKATSAEVSTFPFVESFENGTSFWSFIDGDGDGYNFNFGAYQNAHSGGNVAYSESYVSSYYSGQALTPDNWIISPKMVIPEDSQLKLSWWHMILDGEYCAEKYSVYIATENTVAAMTANASNCKFTYTGTPSDTIWNSPTPIDLSEYAGSAIYIAFRHYDCTDQYVLMIDDVVIAPEGTPIADISGDTYAEVNGNATLNAIAISGDNLTYTWASTLGTVTATGSNASIAYTAAGIDTVTLTVSNGSTSATYTHLVTVIDCGESDLPYFDGFEAGHFMCWSIDDLDSNQDVYWQVMNGGYEGSYCAAINYTESAGDNWLITKQLSIPRADAIELSFYYAVRSEMYPEDFEVLISRTGNQPADFTTVLFSDTAADNTDWRRVSIDLSEYTTSDVYIAIHHRSTDAWTLYIDNFYVGEPLPPTITINAPSSALSTETVNLTATITSFEEVVDNNIAWTIGNTTLYGPSIDYQWDEETGDYEYSVKYHDSFGTDSVNGTIHIINCSTPISEFPYSLSFGSTQVCWEYEGWEPYNGNNISYLISEATADDESQISHTFSTNIYAIPGGDAPQYELELWLANIGAASFKLEATDVDAGTTTTITSGELNIGTYFAPQRYDLSAFAGKNIRFSGTHTGDTSTGVAIQYMYIRPIEAPSVYITVPTEGRTGTDIELTSIVASAINATYQWTIEGASPATATTANATATWSAAGTYTVTLTVTNAVGSNSDTATITIWDCSQPISQFPTTQDFEEGLGCWETWRAEETDQQSNFGLLYNSNIAYRGNYCFTFDPYAQVEFDYTQYLISPELNLGGVDRGIEFYVSKYQEYAAVPFEVRYSTTDNRNTSFNNVARASGGNFTGFSRFNAVIPANAKYVAITYTGSQAQGYLFIDDITFLAAAPTELTGIESANTVQVSLFPNPATSVLNIQADGLRQVEVLDINGRVLLTSTEATIDLSTLANGMYMVRTITTDGIAINKIVKQ
ncbi:MAG: choice-of-anchor J domain-containing protein [Bacteroidales bacterium]|nr:choice-of-anchor J domain-containing protein [Bacteroidales bacterium]